MMGSIFPLRSRFLSAVVAFLVLAASGGLKAEMTVGQLIQEGDTLRASGDLTRAVNVLSRAVEAAGEPVARSYALTALGIALREAGATLRASSTLREAMKGAHGDPALIALREANFALALIETKRPETRAGARERLTEARQAADRAVVAAGAADPLVAALVSALAGSFFALDERPDEALIAIRRGFDNLETSRPASTTEIRVALKLGEAALAVGSAVGDEMAQSILSPIARAPHSRLRSLASVALGELALRREDAEEAKQAALNAMQSASAIGALDLTFAATWLDADADRMLGRDNSALFSYRRAFDILRRLRDETPLGSAPPSQGRRFAARAFQRSYLALIFDKDPNDERTPGLLQEALTVADDLRVAELEEYFQVRCARRPDSVSRLEASDAETLVVYPIIFEERTELIYSIGGTLVRRTQNIGRDEIRRDLFILRTLLEERLPGIDPYRSRFFELLIRPIETQLRSSDIKNIVFIPDGSLRSLPFSILSDGEKSIIQNYSIVSALGLNLVDNTPLDVKTARTFASGAQAVEGFSRLDAVPTEINAIAMLLDADIALDDQFTVDNLVAALSSNEYDIVHLASHAEIGSDPTDNFIATVDGQLDMNLLQSILRARALRGGEPIDLLTLSACDTASGDGGLLNEAATLGLASVAYRSGARSVLASLWKADDYATAELMAAFYRGLANGLSKAEALRAAQLSLIADPAKSDPYLWSGFLLLGAWK